MTNRPRRMSGPSGYGVITAPRSASCCSAVVSRSARSGPSAPVFSMAARYPAGGGVHVSHAFQRQGVAPAASWPATLGSPPVSTKRRATAASLMFSA